MKNLKENIEKEERVNTHQEVGLLMREVGRELKEGNRQYNQQVK